MRGCSHGYLIENLSERKLLVQTKDKARELEEKYCLGS